jgi:hypothetical protein
MSLRLEVQRMERLCIFGPQKVAMAQAKDGKTFNRVPAYMRRGTSGADVTMKEHTRSNPTTSTGRTKAK